MSNVMSFIKKIINTILNTHYYHIWWDGWSIHDHRVPTWIRECKECGRVEHIDYAGYKQILEEGDYSKN